MVSGFGILSQCPALRAKPGDICPPSINIHSRENEIPEQIAQRDLFPVGWPSIRCLAGPGRFYTPVSSIQSPGPIRWLLNAAGGDLITSCEVLGALPYFSDFQCYSP